MNRGEPWHRRTPGRRTGNAGRSLDGSCAMRWSVSVGAEAAADALRRPATPRARPSSHSGAVRWRGPLLSCPPTGSGRRLAALFSARGWGQLRYAEAHPGVGSLEAFDWAESQPDDAAEQPSCHFTTGAVGQPARQGSRCGGRRHGESSAGAAAMTAAASCSAGPKPCTQCMSTSPGEAPDAALRGSAEWPASWRSITASDASASPSAILPPPSHSRWMSWCAGRASVRRSRPWQTSPPSTASLTSWSGSAPHPGRRRKRLDPRGPRFGEKLAERAGVGVTFADERLTSVAAERAVRSLGLKRSEREEKERVDAAAAVLILQAYLDLKRRTRNLKELDE
jgi:hypothetical protein